MTLPTKVVYDIKTILEPITTGQGGITATGTGVRLTRPLNGFAFVLDVTAATGAVADTLDVTVQTRVDDSEGENWLDVVRFTQVLGNGGAKQHVSKLSASAAQTGYESGVGLGENSVRHIFGDEWRVKYVQADLSETAQFTFGVTACPM